MNNVYVTRRCRVLVLHQFDRTDVLSPPDVDTCRPKTRRKANAFYLDDLPSQTEFGDRRALSDRNNMESKYKNAWVDMTGPKTRSFVRFESVVQSFAILC